jgi:hypothetical protein
MGHKIMNCQRRVTKREDGKEGEKKKEKKKG